MAPNGYCMCRCVLSDQWLEYPFVRQGVMHAPVGCIRQELTLWELQHLYRQLTGYPIYNDVLRSVYQACMGHLALNLDFASTLPVTLTPGVQNPPTSLEISPPSNKRERYRTTTTPRDPVTMAKRQPVVYAPGPIKPPWEK
jgi:hypothetical protein